MSVFPLDVSATSGDFGAFGAFESASHLPPVPGAAPFPARGRPPPMGAPLPALPMMVAQSAMPSAAPTAVDTSWSSAGPPLASYGDPAPASPQAALPDVLPEDAHSLGLAFILLGLGTFLGTKYVGGGYGGVAGAMYGGAATNLLRAARCVTRGTPASDHEAMVSATYGVLGVGLGSYVVWKAKHPSKGERA